MSVGALARSIGSKDAPLLAARDPEAMLKALQWAIVDLAMEYLRLNHAASYSDAAEIFRVGIHQLRARVNYRYGSLENLRSGYLVDGRVMLYSYRPCLRCKRVSPLEDGARLCRKCRA